jgi:Right handed beta helix region
MKSSKMAIGMIGALATALFALGGGAALAAGNTTRYVAPGGSDTGNTCTSKTNPCQTVQHAVDVALPGDTVSLDKGIYVEQVTIGTSLTLKGKDDQTMIQAPAVMTGDALDGKRNIVEIGSGASVVASHLTVSGPMPPITCGDSGIAVIGGATLSIDHSAVRDIGSPDPSCSDAGEGIRAGTQRHSGNAEVGHIIVSHVEVTNYNRNGIVVSGAGSTGDLDHNVVATSPNPLTPTNGIEAFNGGVFSADHNTVSGNECNLPPGPGGCGSDFVNEQQSGGFLIWDSPGPISIAHNDVTGNDVGIYVTGGAGAVLDTGVVLDHNKVNQNLFVGIFMTDGAPDPVVSHNETNENGEFGILLGTVLGGAYSGGGSFNDNGAKDNGTTDLSWDGFGTPTFHHNHCGTAVPSKAAWDCK